MLGFCFLGHFSISQEATVRGTEGGTLTAYCEYSPGWESYKKWWCRGKYWNSCRMLVKTTGSEQLVKKGRASIQDNHSRHTITMTLENLWYDDADIYWCGIERTGSDLGYKFSMVVDPGRHYSLLCSGALVPTHGGARTVPLSPLMMERSL